MSIAAVTAALKNMLASGLAEAGLHDVLGGDLTISSLPPDRVPISGAQDPNQLNIFLYKTTFNSGWRNVAQPVRNSSGDRVTNPPLALNLHYLLSAYGSQDYFPEILLGHAMQVFHEYPVLPRAFIEQALIPATGLPKELLGSSLSTQVEQLNITPEAMDPESLSRFWSALQAHYRPTVMYQVGVVLIEASRPRRAALPVTQRTLATVPLQGISIDTATVGANNTIVIQGSNLRGVDTRVEVGGMEFQPPPANVSPEQIALTLPVPLPVGFYAGVKGVQVVHEVSLGNPPSPRGLFRSNIAAVVWRPSITATAQGVTDQAVGVVTYRTGSVKLGFTPNIGRSQTLEVLLSEYNPPSNRPALACSFPGPTNNGIGDPATPDTATVVVPFQKILPGTYLVRVQVDGAESALTMDSGIFANPRIAI
jgi:hypothetical protein